MPGAVPNLLSKTIALEGTNACLRLISEIGVETYFENRFSQIVKGKVDYLKQCGN